MAQTSEEWLYVYSLRRGNLMEPEYSEYGEAYERLRTDWERDLWRQAVAVLDQNRVERERRRTFGQVADHEVRRVA